MMLRQIFWDRANETPAALRLERIDAAGPPAPLDPTFMASASRGARHVRTNLIIFHFADRFGAGPTNCCPGTVANERLQGIPPSRSPPAGGERPEQAAYRLHAAALPLLELRAQQLLGAIARLREPPPP